MLVNENKLIDPIYIIREYMRLKCIQQNHADYDADGNRNKIPAQYEEEGQALASKLIRETPIKDFYLSLDDFSDKYIAPILGISVETTVDKSQNIKTYKYRQEAS